ncbi:MAG: type II toxin-antitoxin system RelE/ParE family toxin [Pseudomonadota bacterium]
MEWQIIYNNKIEQWLDNLTKKQLKYVAKELKLLEMAGHTLKLPHSRSLGSGLFELRERKFGYRLYYCFAKKQLILLLTAGNKTSQLKDITIARKLLIQFRRHSNENTKLQNIP